MRTLRSTRHEALWIAARALLEGGGRLPLGTLRVLGRTIAAIGLRTAGTSRRRADSHLAAAFPEMDPERRRRLVAGCFRHFGETLAEIAWLWRAAPGQVDRLVSISGVEHLEADRGGAVLITGHCGNWELLNARMATAGIPMVIAVREVFDPRLDEVATRLRARFGATVIARGQDAGRKLVAALAESRVLGLLIDQDIRDVPGCFVPFFGRPAWTPTGAAAIALKVGRPVVPAFVHRRSDGTHHVDVQEPLPAPRGQTGHERTIELTAAATAAIERHVRAYPEQWVWFHRRWRTRPDREPGR